MVQIYRFLLSDYIENYSYIVLKLIQYFRSVVQAWYKCEDCGYASHYKCLASILRECAHVVVCERGQYELNICPEIGISAQKYQCAECKTPLILSKCLLQISLI